MIPIYVFGSSNTDMVIKARKLPGPGETIMGGSFLMNAGGKGANQAVAASRLGGKVTLVCKVGNDLFGKEAMEQFRKENIDTGYVQVDSEHSSGVALINVDEQGENTIVVAPGSNGFLQREDVDLLFANVSPSGIVLVQLEIPIATVEHVIQRSAEKGLKVILNPAPAHALPESIYRNLYVITPNESEAELLTGIKITDVESVHSAGKRLLMMGVKNVIITLGSKGAFLCNDKGNQLIPAPQVTPTDTTAAGDCFNGSLAVAISESLPLDQAIGFAVKAASISTTRLGAQASLPTRHEVDSWNLSVVQ
jgi:ribokinase